ncbi:helix-turn-helix transcriptional regulator [Xenophilus sp.]|uniref:helix-turn-helix transcriptional regulator n=1 Tax=Xenophilus sp. TaxID=1873499 RepID=UPI0037DC8A09
MSDPTVATKERLLRIEEVLRRVGFRTTTLYKLMGEGRFPRPIALGRRTVVWPESLVDQWIDARVREAYAPDSAGS